MGLMYCFFFFYDTAAHEIYTIFHTLSLHDALPIWKKFRMTIARRTTTALTIRWAMKGSIGVSAEKQNRRIVRSRRRMRQRISPPHAERHAYWSIQASRKR